MIRCFIPEGFSNAEMIISSQNGIVLQRIPLANSGLNEISVDAETASNGTYQYSAWSLTEST